MTKTVIYINGRFLTQPVTGVQRYSRELLRHMDALAGNTSSPCRDVDLVCLAPREKFDHPGWENIEIRKVGLNKGNLWEQADLPLYADGKLLFSPANIGPWAYRNQAVTLHDASVFAVPEAYSLAFRAKYYVIFKQLVRHARLLVTDSEFSRQELSRYLHVPPARFTLIPPGAGHLDDVQADTQVLERYDLKKNSYLFTVANPRLHKNLHRVLEAIDLTRIKMKVIIAGPTRKQLLRTMETVPTQARVLGYVRDGELKALYENATGLIFASTYEGFGLPVLEAMRCGCPVMSSNAASLPEIARNAAVYFDPYRAKSIAAALEEFLSLPQLREQLRARGYQHSAQFEWQTTARRVLEQLLNLVL